MEAATQLINGLSGEKERWTDQSDQFQEQRKRYTTISVRRISFRRIKNNQPYQTFPSLLSFSAKAVLLLRRNSKIYMYILPIETNQISIAKYSFMPLKIEILENFGKFWKCNELLNSHIQKAMGSKKMRQVYFRPIAFLVH